MTGKWITNQQVEIYMKSRIQGYTQETSAAKAGMSVRTGRTIEHGERHHPNDIPRHWRTRPDPLNAVWDGELAPMLKREPGLGSPGIYGEKRNSPHTYRH
ncbi:MAG: hypothetical protein K2Q14_02145 [Gammaproteobacteria bacterium]|nr:hypothetical protein [Gammaproteobacteria bacterium]